MKQALLAIDVQPSFHPPAWLVNGITDLSKRFYTLATVERHNEAITPFWRQLGWKPATNDEALIPADQVFIKYGYLPPQDLVNHLKAKGIEQVLVCGLQTETCCLAAGFMLFDAGLHPTLLNWLTLGSSLDRSGQLGADLWRHHFGDAHVYEALEALAP